MQSRHLATPSSTFSMIQNSKEATGNKVSKSKTPRSILPQVFAFAPNRDTLGATSYLIVEKTHNILIDCPLWHEEHFRFIQQQGGVSKLLITHRGSIGKQVKQMQADLGCQVIIQEQEAYLLPEVEVSSFRDSLTVDSAIELIWTPGHSPGSSCVYWNAHGGVLFTGRHLLPKSVTEVVPLHTAKTFHWWRQLRSIAKLRDRFSEENLNYIIPGANTGYLRGKGYLDDAYNRLCEIDLAQLKQSEASSI